jgi:ribosomal protein S18 acetylase RimI-like enzyme
MNVPIRAAVAQDYEDLCALIDQGDALHRDNLPDIFREAAGPIRDRDYIAGLLADDSVGLFVAGRPGELAGFIHVVVRDSPPLPILVPRRYAVIDNIAVRAGGRRQGIGTALMDHAQRWALAKGATTIELNVYAFNGAAIAFYLAQGYGVVSQRMSRPLG